jgi:predicted regulator of Ras-like GTPase activity (Roadblock/LC7/MglB family)
MDEKALNLRGNLVLYPPQLQKIDQLLDQLIEKLPARLALLTQTSGQMVAFRAASGGAQNVDSHALGALIAGDLAASREIARVTGTYEECQLVLRQGQQVHTLIAEVGNEFALLVQVNSQTPLGWARMVTLDIARQLAQAVQPITPPASEWSDTDQDLSHLIGDSLDSIWTEGPDVR